MIKVTVFNENLHEVEDPAVRAAYPDGIHGTIKGFLESDEVVVRTVTQFNEKGEEIPNCGITEELLKDTDVLIWSSLFFGEGNGSPLQYSCLENPMDGGAW